jgi:hypothetical protein
VRSGFGVGINPVPLRPGWPPRLRSFDRTRDDRSARCFAVTARESFDDGVDEFDESFPNCRFTAANSASTASNRAVNRSTNDRSSPFSAARSS